MIRPRLYKVLWTGIVFVLVALFPITVGYPATIGSKFPIATTAMRELSAGAAFDGTNFLVGIQGDAPANSSITAQLVSQSGTLVGPRISVGRTGGAPLVAFDGTNYLMVWPDDAAYPVDNLFGQFISQVGALVGSPFLITAGVHSNGASGLVFNGTRIL